MLPAVTTSAPWLLSGCDKDKHGKHGGRGPGPVCQLSHCVGGVMVVLGVGCVCVCVCVCVCGGGGGGGGGEGG